MSENHPARLTKTQKTMVLLDASSFSESKMSESKPARLKKSLKSRVLLDKGSFPKFKMNENKPPRLTKSLKSKVLLDTDAFHESKMSENAERPASSRPRIGSKGAADRLERVFPAADLHFSPGPILWQCRVNAFLMIQIS